MAVAVTAFTYPRRHYEAEATVQSCSVGGHGAAGAGAGDPQTIPVICSPGTEADAHAADGGRFF
eukprot:m.273547 g.273547  ORF g.273547 m.273547 type:complete len:64 (-) comp22851_c4_seq6:3490-3681(-)